MGYDKLPIAIAAPESAIEGAESIQEAITKHCYPRIHPEDYAEDPKVTIILINEYQYSPGIMNKTHTLLRESNAQVVIFYNPRGSKEVNNIALLFARENAKVQVLYCEGREESSHAPVAKLGNLRMICGELAKGLVPELCVKTVEHLIRGPKEILESTKPNFDEENRPEPPYGTNPD